MATFETGRELFPAARERLDERTCEAQAAAVEQLREGPDVRLSEAELATFVRSSEVAIRNA